MEAEIIKRGDVTLVSLKGFLNFETTVPFKKICFQRLINNNIVFDLKGLNFVGSSGLTSFVEVLKEFRSKNSLPVKFCGLNQEFRRLFWASDMGEIEVYEDGSIAYSSFFQSMPQVPRPRYELDAEIEITENSVSVSTNISEPELIPQEMLSQNENI